MESFSTSISSSAVVAKLFIISQFQTAFKNNRNIMVPGFLFAVPFYSFISSPGIGQPEFSSKPFTQLNTHMAEETDISLRPHFPVTALHECVENGIQSAMNYGSTSVLYPAHNLSFFGFTSRLQTFGETLLAAALVISFIQAALALYQYRSNPSGELVFPPGLTCGIVYPSSGDSTDGRIFDSKSSTVPRIDHQKNPFHQLQSEDTDQLLQEQNKNQQPRVYARFLFKVNRMMVLLFPWIVQQLRVALIRNAHIFHVFLIISLGSVFDFWSRDPIDTQNEVQLSVIANLSHRKKKEQKVVVIGDSLAVGIGSVEQFDENKNSTLPMFRVERLSRDEKPLNSASLDTTISPVFPQVFAQTLANRLQQRVRWRSAGVDGGDVSDILLFCSGIIEEEARTDHPPDVVVVICGMNDLKKSISNPFMSKSASGFRSSMEQMIDEIRKHAPNASIVFPALPVQMFHKNSVVNILPLSLFIDTIVGFWDSQKKLAADRSPSNVMHLGFGWYDDDHEGESNILIALDGIHPNKRCYSKWAKSMGNKFCDRILMQACSVEDH